ncbi:MAG: hypothetical protein C4539_11745 [Ignavibacteriales bacterium]|nr:MAG: hypothetical protein C4539_11745 [Ignavibacteriales bacterium]
MIIAVTSIENNLDSLVCPQFGRANFFLIINLQTLEFQAIPNPNVNVVDGAGIHSAQLLIKEEIKAVFTGRVGMNAFRILDSAGILVYENVEGTVRVVIDKLKLGMLKASNNLNFNKKFPNQFHGMQCRGSKWNNKGNSVQNEQEILKTEIEELKEKISQLEIQLKQNETHNN